MGTGHKLNDKPLKSLIKTLSSTSQEHDFGGLYSLNVALSFHFLLIQANPYESRGGKEHRLIFFAVQLIAASSYGFVDLSTVLDGTDP